MGKFDIGAKVYHQDAGVGVVIAHVNDKEIKVKFDTRPPVMFNGGVNPFTVFKSQVLDLDEWNQTLNDLKKNDDGRDSYSRGGAQTPSDPEPDITDPFSWLKVGTRVWVKSLQKAGEITEILIDEDTILRDENPIVSVRTDDNIEFKFGDSGGHKWELDNLKPIEWKVGDKILYIERSPILGTITKIIDNKDKVSDGYPPIEFILQLEPNDYCAEQFQIGLHCFENKLYNLSWHRYVPQCTPSDPTYVTPKLK